VKIVDSKEIKRKPKVSPASRMIEALPADLFSARQVADHFGVNIETIRRLARAKDSDGNPKFTAPSKAAKNGDLVVWVYTQDDIDELAEYFGEKARKVRK
jgi:predicted phage gp36 major capsid-like protein